MLVGGDQALLYLYESLMLRRVLAADPDTRWCPAPNCTFAVKIMMCSLLHCLQFQSFRWWQQDVPLVRRSTVKEMAATPVFVITVKQNGILTRPVTWPGLKDNLLDLAAFPLVKTVVSLVAQR